MRTKGMGKIELAVWAVGILLAITVAFYFGLEESLMILVPLVIFGVILYLLISLIIFIGDKYPNHIKIGILLCFIFGPLGQFYLDKSGKYVVTLFVIKGVCLGFFNDKWLVILMTQVSHPLILR
ncbi:MAG: hypothetical protein RBT82_14775 [Desulfomonilia bacterium]|jgi:hypothetical protein|nr:hypothetical protein [Desulfomonilia bacterium]